MTAHIIDRRAVKRQEATRLRQAQVSPQAMTALYMGILLLLGLADLAAGGSVLYGGNLLGTFASILTDLIGMVLAAGFTLYCMAVRRGERAEFLTLFDGFSFVGKIIGLNILISIFVSLWSMLFIIPGIIASYRYRFALYNLLENPSLSIPEALEMSKRQTVGYKMQLFVLDLSYYGWMLLASFPATMLITAQIYEMLPPSAPTLLLSLAASLWNAVVSLFYLARYQCVELAYFDTAKATSGIGHGVQPPQGPAGFPGGRGPDGLGGL